MHIHSHNIKSLKAIPFQASNLNNIINALYGAFNADYTKPQVTAAVNAYLSRTPIVLEGIERTWLDKIIWSERVANGAGPNTIGTDLDPIAEWGADWTLTQTIQYLALSAITPSRKVTIFTSIRNEGINILEWLAHYRALGVTDYLIYTNENTDGSDVLLSALAAANLIKVVSNHTELTGALAIQKKVLNHAIQFLPDLYASEYVFFADVDEYLVLKNARSLPDFINWAESNSEQKDFSGIAFNWRWFVSEGTIRRRPGRISDAYSACTINNMVKSVVKVRDITGFRTSHIPRLLTGSFVVDSELRRADNAVTSVPRTYENAQLNHYWGRSFEEYISKRNRGKGDRPFDLFFQFDRPNRTDVEYIPEWLRSARNQELDNLLCNPAIAEGQRHVEATYTEMVASIDSERAIEDIFADARRAFESAAS